MLRLQILVISLQHSITRQAKVASEMAKTKLQWQFLDAVDGSKLDLSTAPYCPAKVKRLLGFELTPKEIGCYLSHMKAWQACVDQGLPTLVFEDDFVIHPHFEKTLKTLIEQQTSWSLVRLQALCDSSDILVKQFEGELRLVRNNSDPLGATAYIVNPVSARQLLAGSAEIYEPLDHYLEHQEKHGLKMLAIKPYPVEVVDPTRATSTITDRPDRVPVKNFRKIYRSLMRAVDRMTSKNPWFPKS